jgi:hypothetical protein
MRRRARIIYTLAALLGAAIWPGAGAADPGVTTRISVSSDGSQANGLTFNQLSLSADARFVAFSSAAANLVPGDTNECDGTVAAIFTDPGCPDIFVHDRITGAATRVSVDSAGAQANGASLRAVISADGRFVVFASDASNLVAGDTNGIRDIFVHDRLSGAITRVNVDSAGAQANGFSNLGFNGEAMTPDGRFVTFSSSASHLVPGDTNGVGDVFLHDRLTGITTRVSVNSAGVQGNDGSGASSVSADGRFVGFISGATNLVAGDTNATSAPCHLVLTPSGCRPSASSEDVTQAGSPRGQAGWM